MEGAECRAVTRPVIVKSCPVDNGFIGIYIEKASRNEIRIRNGYPIRTKEHNSCHGFGMQSIHYLVEKYGGGLFSGR